MQRHPVELLIVLALVIAATACAGRSTPPSPTLNPAADEELSRIAAAVTTALKSSSAPGGVHLLGVERRRDGSITINISEELLVETSDEKLAGIARQIVTAASTARTETGSQDNFVILVNGALLDSYLPSGPPQV